jgi:hypothetical protein
LIVDLKIWNEEVFGNVKMKKILLEGLSVLDIIEEGRAIGVEESMKKENFVSKLEGSSLTEELSFRQKYRILWLREGDKSMKFFLIMANSKRRRNTIDSFFIDD